jgi:hypothetical protein
MLKKSYFSKSWFWICHFFGFFTFWVVFLGYIGLKKAMTRLMKKKEWMLFLWFNECFVFLNERKKVERVWVGGLLAIIKNVYILCSCCVDQLKWEWGLRILKTWPKRTKNVIIEICSNSNCNFISIVIFGIY